MAAYSKLSLENVNKGRKKHLSSRKSSKSARAAKKLENDAAKQRRLARAADEMERNPESQRRLNKHSTTKNSKKGKKVSAVAIVINGLTYAVIGGPITAYDLSPNCYLVAETIKDILLHEHQIVSVITVICGDSVKELKMTCCTAVTNGYDGSCMSKVCALKLAYRHLFRGKVSYFFSSWCDLANATRAFNPKGRGKAGLGMIIANIPQDELTEAQKNLIVSLKKVDADRVVWFCNVKAYEKHKSVLFLMVQFKGKISGSNKITFNVWMNMTKALPENMWEGRDVNLAKGSDKFQKEVNIIREVVQQNRHLASSSLAKKGGAAYGESTPSITTTVVGIVYKVFGFRESDSAFDPGYGIGTTTMYYEAARRCLSEKELEPKKRYYTRGGSGSVHR